MFKQKLIFIIVGVIFLLVVMPPILALVFGIWPPNCKWVIYPRAIEMCEKAKSGETIESPKQETDMPPYTSQATIPAGEVEKPEMPKEEKPATSPKTTETVKPKQMIDMSLTVTVPYWTQGDVYLGVGDNPTYLKLEKVNEVTYSGKTKLEKGSEYYYYSKGSTDSKEISIERKIADSLIFDVVVDWAGSNKQIVKKNFQKSFYISACHTCGVSYTKGNFIEPIKRTYDEIKRTGGTWVDLVPVWFIAPDYKGNELKPIYSEGFEGASGWIHATIKDRDLITLINAAHSKGLKVYLSPHVAPENWGPGVKGKGDIRPSNPDVFFESYKNFINHYADIAQQTGVEMFSIGNELDSATQEDLILEVPFDKTARWRGVIKSVREHYKGILTYSVACITEERCGPQIIKFWDDLDVIGWEWYVPIATKEHESIDAMKKNAERIIQNNMKPLYDKYGKPIVLTEIGWEAYPGACAHAYGVGPSKGGDRVEQASCYEAVFQAIETKDFVKGMHIWTWTANLEGDKFPWIWTDSANEVRFSITEKEIGKWYSKIKD